MIRRLVLSGFVLLAFSGTPLLATTITPVVEYSTTSTLSDSRPFTLGFEFATSSLFDINALGYWSLEMGNDHRVGIWDTSGNLLLSATVQPTDPVVGHFAYHVIDDYILSPGTYIIGGEFLGDTGIGPAFFPGKPDDVVSLPGYSYIGDRQVSGAGLSFPTSGSTGYYGDNGIFLVDFSGVPIVTPEPSSLWLIATGLVGVVRMIRRKSMAG